MGDFLAYFKQKKNLTSLLILGIIILGLPVGIQLLRSQKIIKSEATGEPIDFTGGANVEKRGNEWVVLNPLQPISFFMTSTLGPAGPEPTITPVPQSDEITINLAQGWNLISFPRPLINSSVSDTFNGYANKVYYFNLSKQDWDFAIWRDGKWNGNLTSLEAGKAYWIDTNANVKEIRIKVVKKAGGSIIKPPVTNNSWNMIGYSTLTDNNMDIGAYLSSVGINNWEKVYRLSGSSWAIAIKDQVTTYFQVKVGEGYWVCVGVSCGVRPEPTASPGAATATPEPTAAPTQTQPTSAPALGIPQNLKANCGIKTGTLTAVDFSWNVVSGAQSYRLSVTNSTATMDPVAAGNSLNNFQIANGINHTWTVAACNKPDGTGCGTQATAQPLVCN